ncbi:hypothetical protein N7452_007368 [Penicillium brevicompactum]|uniref:Beta-lactamase/transpeptidase-like protein n=1 Tax=Penicillium brevicompactum TaxID=5074 RepID=A0A9W9QKN1_PENBR|nr:hypothetical protein N7452_007368 [Penicillium brevicompactum]
MSSHESPFDEEFDKLVKIELEKWKVPGLSIAIVQESEISAKAYGLAELPSGTHAPRPMTTDALFAACSTTKAFTSAATAIAIRDSQDTKSPMSWSTTLASLIPGDFVLEDDHATQNVTLEDALSHRTGMPQHNWTLAFFKSKGATPASTVRAMRYMPLATPLRSKYHYSNHMYTAVSHALEQRTGIPLGTFMKNRIWKPLKMNDTYFGAAEAKEEPSSAARFVQGYDWIPAGNGGSFATRPEHDWPSNSGAGAIHSNVTDYARWAKELIDPTGPLKGHETLIKPRTICLEDEDADLPAPFHGYALGWAVDNYRGQYLYSHGGGWPGYASHVGFVPSKKFGWVIMGNSSSARYAAFRLFTFLLDKYLQLPADPDYEAKIAAIITRQEKGWQAKLVNETPEVSKQRLFPRLPDPPILHSLLLIKYTGTYLHRSEAMIDLRIESGCLVADLQDRVIPCELSISHASGEFFIGRIYRTGLDLLPPFMVEFCLDSAGKVTKMGLLIEPDINEQKIWFERLGI